MDDTLGSSTTGSTEGTTGPATTDEPDTTSGGPTSTTDPGTTTTGGACGDGVVDEGEECDDGRNNADYGPCTTMCTTAVCGDGFQWVGTEACDLGPLNGVEGSGCSSDCQSLGICGDGVRDPSTEECDEEDLNGFGSCSVTCELVGQLVFVTAATFNGDLQAHGPVDGDGVAGADAICRSEAAAGFLHHPERFLAWISVSAETAPASRFPAAAYLAGPYILPVTGDAVAASWDALVSGSLEHPINRTAAGATIRDGKVWTNTTIQGELGDPATSCDGWTSSDALTTGGRGRSSATSSSWTDHDVWQCNFAVQHLYCIEMREDLE